MNLGIFGGSFSPVHLGHYEIARQILAKGAVDRVLVVPAHQSPFKTNQKPLDAALRLALLEATFADLADVSIERLELDRPEVSYTSRTIEAFARRWPEARLFLILGEDSFAQFHCWHQAETIIKRAELLVFSRQLDKHPDLEASRQFCQGRYHWLDLDLPQISSTEIRQGTNEEAANTHWLHPNARSVWEAHR